MRSYTIKINEIGYIPQVSEHENNKIFEIEIVLENDWKCTWEELLVDMTLQMSKTFGATWKCIGEFFNITHLKIHN